MSASCFGKVQGQSGLGLTIVFLDIPIKKLAMPVFPIIVLGFGVYVPSLHRDGHLHQRKEDIPYKFFGYSRFGLGFAVSRLPPVSGH